MKSMRGLMLNMENVAVHVQSEDLVEAVVEEQVMRDLVKGQQRPEIINIIHVAGRLQAE